jgi:hypothetical protein
MDTLLVDVPDEFFNTIKSYELSLVSKFVELRTNAIVEFVDIVVKVDENDRKAFASEVMRRKYPGLLFALYDKKPINDIIWKLIKPDFKKL